MTVTLVLPQRIADELLEQGACDVETAGVLLARPVATPRGDVRLLARAMHWVPEDAYDLRTGTELRTRFRGLRPRPRSCGGGPRGADLAPYSSGERVVPLRQQA